jgi:hypothetical protein
VLPPRVRADPFAARRSQALRASPQRVRAKARWYNLIQGAGWRGRPARIPKALSFDLRSHVLAAVDTLLRKAAERTLEGLWATIGRLIDLFTPDECARYFEAAGYDPI